MTIMKLIKLLGEVLGLGNKTLKKARKIHAFYVPKIVAGFLLLLATAVFFNYIGWPGFSLWSALFLTAAYLILATRPEPWLVARGLIEIRDVKVETTDEEKKAGKGDYKTTKETYIRPVFKALFWFAAILLVISKIHVKANPQAVLTGLVAAIIILSYVIGFEVKFAIARRLLYAFACVMLIVSVLQVSGLDMFTSNPTEIGVNKLERTAEKERQTMNAKVLRVMELKAEQSGGKPLDEVLTPEELETFVKLSNQRDARSWKNKFSSFFEHREAKAALAPPPPPPPLLKEKREALLPATPPPTPPVASPRPLSKPRWEICERRRSPYHPESEKPLEECFSATVTFGEGNREITIVRHDAAATTFRGLATGEGRMEGHWLPANNNWDGSGKFHLQFDKDQTWEYARGWRTLNNERTVLELKKTILLQDH